MPGPPPVGATSTCSEGSGGTSVPVQCMVGTTSNSVELRFITQPWTAGSKFPDSTSFCAEWLTLHRYSPWSKMERRFGSSEIWRWMGDLSVLGLTMCFPGHGEPFLYLVHLTVGDTPAACFTYQNIWSILWLKTSESCDYYHKRWNLYCLYIIMLLYILIYSFKKWSMICYR